MSEIDNLLSVRPRTLTTIAAAKPADAGRDGRDAWRRLVAQLRSLDRRLRDCEALILALPDDKAGRSLRDRVLAQRAQVRTLARACLG